MLDRTNGQVDSNLVEANSADNPILSELECAKYLGISVATMRRLRNAGKIAYVQISDHRIGYRRSTLNKLLDERTVQHATT
jgi:predicted site-specific integrase-resolvase